MSDRSAKGQIWICNVCGYVYDPSSEDSDFLDLPDDWVCPVCGAGKDDFDPQE